MCKEKDCCQGKQDKKEKEDKETGAVSQKELKDWREQKYSHWLIENRRP